MLHGETDRYSRAANQKGKGYQMGYYPKRKESPKGPLTKKERVCIDSMNTTMQSGTIRDHIVLCVKATKSSLNLFPSPPARIALLFLMPVELIIDVLVT